MTFLEKHQCLERLKDWLRKGRGGNLEELADAFNVSTRTMKRWIAHLREHEKWELEFCRLRRKYIFNGIKE